MLRIEPLVYFAAALMLLILPLRWILAALIAGMFHELCHIGALLLVKGRIKSISVGAHGCVIEAYPLGWWKQFFCILAGPLGGFLLLLFWRNAPEIAVCGLMHSLYNLMPLLPQDGGRLLYLLLEGIVPEKADRIMVVTAWVFAALAGLALVWMIRALHYDTGCILVAVLWFLRILPRKIPCKPTQSKVQ